MEFRLSRQIGGVLVLLLCAGCSHETTYFRPTQSADKSEMTSSAAKAVANDVVLSIKSIVGPPNTPVNLSIDDQNFGIALREAMSKAGYRIDGDANTTGMSYSVVNIDGQALVRVTTPNFEFTRAYAFTASGANPVSPVSLMRRPSA
jgi:hypothetical protein